jgi:hypothetical protein
METSRSLYHPCPPPFPPQQTRKSDYFVFKKVTVESARFSLVPRTSRTAVPILLLADTPLECHATVRRAMDDVATW